MRRHAKDVMGLAALVMLLAGVFLVGPLEQARNVDNPAVVLGQLAE